MCARASHSAIAAGLLVNEDVVGFALPVVRLVPGVVWMPFGLPDPPPQAAWRDSIPVVPGGLPCAGAMAAVRDCENWIVDASKAKVFESLFCC